MEHEKLNTEEVVNSDLGAIKRSFSLEDLKKAFEAGDELVNQDWHEKEFCIEEGCRCGGVRLKYSNFDEWVSQNYA